jgi:hypothetical protein
MNLKSWMKQDDTETIINKRLDELFKINNIGGKKKISPNRKSNKISPKKKSNKISPKRKSNKISPKNKLKDNAINALNKIIENNSDESIDKVKDIANFLYEQTKKISKEDKINQDKSIDNESIDNESNEDESNKDESNEDESNKDESNEIVNCLTNISDKDILEVIKKRNITIDISYISNENLIEEVKRRIKNEN